MISIFLGIPGICRIVLLFQPDNRLAEAVIGFVSLIWILFKQFELEDTIIEAGLYILFVVGLTGFGINIKENKIWAIVSLLMIVIMVMKLN